MKLYISLILHCHKTLIRKAKYLLNHSIVFFTDLMSFPWYLTTRWAARRVKLTTSTFLGTCTNETLNNDVCAVHLSAHPHRAS